MIKRERYQEQKEILKQLQEEDDSYPQAEDSRFPNFTESKDEHHRPVGLWAGALQRAFGPHRRGPTSDRKYHG